MASISGIRATGSDREEYSRKPILKNAAGYVVMPAGSAIRPDHSRRVFRV